MKSLYQHAFTRVAINGFLSSPFQVTRGVRQGDPLSCPIFDLAIEPLACRLRNDPELHGFQIPGIAEKIISKFFADDTSLYLGKHDRFDRVKLLLREWCEVSGAKFNMEKTEIIPIGSERHRKDVAERRKVNPLDENPLDDRIRIAKDGDAIRLLGAWIRNKTNDLTPWETIIDKIKKALNFRSKSNPTMHGRKLIIQAIVGGHTQFLTKAQGMPKPIEEGGLGLLDIKACNEAIDISWLRSYLNFSPSRPTWAKVSDPIIALAAITGAVPHARSNPFTQIWKVATRGAKHKLLDNSIARMLKVANKYNVKIAALRLSAELRSQLPAWYHVSAHPRPISNRPSKCLLKNHSILIIADLLEASARIRTPSPTSPHTPSPNCPCSDCSHDRNCHCRNPHECTSKALARIHTIFPKLNPLRLGDPHDNLSLTRHRKRQNITARANKDLILFNPSITCKDNLAECFRIFTNPDRLSNFPAQRYYTNGITLRQDRPITIYTDGACFNNGKLNAKCGSGIWFSPNDD